MYLSDKDIRQKLSELNIETDNPEFGKLSANITAHVVKNQSP